MSTVRVLWGQRIADARRAVGMSQVQLAGALGVTQQLVSAWEHGHASPKIDRRPLVARILGVHTSDLFGYPDDDDNGEAAA